MKSTFRLFLILTFIGSGICCLSYFFTAFMLPTMQALFSSENMAMTEEMKTVADTILPIISAPGAFAYFLLSAILYGVSLTGAIFMWKLRRYGFHIYTIAQLLTLAMPVIFLGPNYFGIGDAMLTFFFIIFYFFALRTLLATEEYSEDTSVPDKISDDDEEDNEDDED
ncbi:MAG: hypothetical protein IJ764_03380 [Bacteroidales bacterium]|nr:hypothetical protein [Bacteroidales bacterium]